MRRRRRRGRRRSRRSWPEVFQRRCLSGVSLEGPTRPTKSNSTDKPQQQQCPLPYRRVRGCLLHQRSEVVSCWHLGLCQWRREQAVTFCDVFIWHVGSRSAKCQQNSNPGAHRFGTFERGGWEAKVGKFAVMFHPTTHHSPHHRLQGAENFVFII